MAQIAGLLALQLKIATELFLHWELLKAGNISCHLVYGLEKYSLVWNILSLELRAIY